MSADLSLHSVRHVAAKSGAPASAWCSLKVLTSSGEFEVTLFLGSPVVAAAFAQAVNQVNYQEDCTNDA